MARPRTTLITESAEELKQLRGKQKSLKQQQKVECLYLLKTGRFKTQKEIASHLFVSLKSIDRWLRTYRKGGIEALTAPLTRNKPSKIITTGLHMALEKKLNDSQGPFLGYCHAQKWIKEEFGIEVQYQWLRTYLIKHFKTKLKSPRKSHVKKDGQAVEVFLKTSRTTGKP